MANTTVSQDGEKRSIVWSFYVSNKVEQNAQCTICKQHIKATNGSTTGLRGHLMNKHKVKWLEHLKENEISKENNQESSSIKQGKEGSSSTTGKQTTLDTRHKSQLLDKLLLDVFVENNFAFNAVGSASFDAFLRVATPHYAPPSRQRMVDDVLHKKYDLAVDALKSEIKAQMYSITTDEWSSLNHTVSLLSVTFHYINQCGKRVNSIGAAIYLGKARHTSEALKEALCSKIEHLGQITENMVGFTSDGASVMQAVYKDIQALHPERCISKIHCMCHVLHLCVTLALESSDVDSVITKVRCLMTTMRRSNKMMKELESYQLEDNKRPIKPQVNCKTRWNSAYVMLKTFIYLQTYIEKVARNNRGKIELLDTEQIILIENCTAILEPFFEATAKMSGSSSTVCHITLIFFALKKKLSDKIVDYQEQAQEFAEQLLSELKKRSLDAIHLDKFCLFEPRIAFKGYLFSDSAWKNTASYWVEEMIIDNDSQLESSIEEVEKVPENITESGLFTALEENNSTDTVATSLLSRKAIIEEEMATYKRYVTSSSFPSIEKEPNYIYAFWSQYPHGKHLARMAKKVLSIPASGADSERLFSAAGLISNNKLRNRLRGEKYEQLLLLRSRRVREAVKNECNGNIDSVLHILPKNWTEVEGEYNEELFDEY